MVCFVLLWCVVLVSCVRVCAILCDVGCCGVVVKCGVVWDRESEVSLVVMLHIFGEYLAIFCVVIYVTVL